MYQGMFAVYAVVFLVVCMIVAVSIKSLQKRSFDEFDTTEQGIVVNGKTYPWSDIKYYSWYGERQDDRIGIIGVVPYLNYDPINPYKFGKTQIVELHLGLMRRVNLQIDSTQVENLSSIFSKYGAKHISMFQKITGV